MRRSTGKDKNQENNNTGDESSEPLPPDEVDEGNIFPHHFMEIEQTYIDEPETEQHNKENILP